MRLNMRFMNGPTGGIHYHFRALRAHQNSGWSEFTNEVRTWLIDIWSPSESELIIFGPSAGWTLPIPFFKRFGRVLAIEPDPVARQILRYRFTVHGLNSNELRFETSPHWLPWFSQGRFSQLLKQRPHAAVLFANLLGQVELLHPPRAALSARQEFLAALEGRTWASYHDLLSAVYADPLPRQLHLKAENKRYDSIAQDALNTLAEIFENESGLTSLLEHDTWWLSAERETQLALWRLTATQSHLVAFVHESNAARPHQPRSDQTDQVKRT